MPGKTKRDSPIAKRVEKHQRVCRIMESPIQRAVRADMETALSDDDYHATVANSYFVDAGSILRVEIAYSSTGVKDIPNKVKQLYAKYPLMTYHLETSSQGGGLGLFFELPLHPKNDHSSAGLRELVSEFFASATTFPALCFQTAIFGGIMWVYYSV
jgi:hypothetical protein